MTQQQQQQQQDQAEDKSLLQRVGTELQTLREHEKTSQKHHEDGKRFPSACKKYLLSLTGNTRCVDCGMTNPDWASITYGTLLCVRCSGRHRSYGVTKSRVRSISMDNWSHTQIVAMLEGGNQQLQLFFQRHGMESTQYGSGRDRYKTKAALFYRTHLDRHVDKVVNAGTYKGRTVSRRQKQQHRQEPEQQNDEVVPGSSPAPSSTTLTSEQQSLSQRNLVVVQ